MEKKKVKRKLKKQEFDSDSDEYEDEEDEPDCKDFKDYEAEDAYDEKEPSSSINRPQPLVILNGHPTITISLRSEEQLDNNHIPNFEKVIPPVKPAPVEEEEEEIIEESGGVV